MSLEGELDLALAAWADRHGVEVSSVAVEWNREDGEVRHIVIRDESGRSANFLLSWERGSREVIVEASDIVHRRPSRIHTTRVPIDKLPRALDKNMTRVGFGRHTV
jgi:hypothetical protein